MSATESRFVSTRAAAEKIGVSVRTVQLWVEAGILKAWKTEGGHRRVSLASVQTLLRRREQDAARAAGEAAAGPLRVLAVDDDAHLRSLYEATLRSLPFQVEFKMAEDGYTGLVRIGDFRPHVVIADLNLPGLDGFRLVRALKGAPESRDAELIVVSTLTREDIQDRGGLPPGVAVLSRPVPRSTLEQLMAAANARRHAAPSREPVDAGPAPPAC
ncbi:response regulator [Bordetella bronchialis]|uniref:Response regulatory domain-containing protein n=1 Tax=Bordetella bronchialis TaxID=463025 RepID=A0A193G1Y1_9BORD|nr:response regulator [Bordetella bronchialis]ANN68316.1 hypothetical protein BAU06_20220 [Bordetella bronchialis]ANN73456.1 hypothetical protein BAU08_20750 [Bordetella bronchialis]